MHSGVTGKVFVTLKPQSVIVFLFEFCCCIFMLTLIHILSCGPQPCHDIVQAPAKVCCIWTLQAAQQNYCVFTEFSLTEVYTRVERSLVTEEFKKMI